jgi:hypothetical protein
MFRRNRSDAHKDPIVGEGAKELEVAFARLMHAGEDGVHDAQPRILSNAHACHAFAGVYVAGDARRLECTHDGRPNRDDASAFGFGSINLRCGGLGDAIGLIKRKPQIEPRVSRRGDAGSMRECGELDAAPAPDTERAPVKRKSG